MRILFLTNNLNTVNGITTFLYQKSKLLIEKYNYEIYIIYSGGNETKKFKELGVKLFDKNFLSFEKRSRFNFLRSIIFCFYLVIRHNIDIINPQIHYSAAYSFYLSIILKKAFIQTVHGVISKFNKLKPLYGKNFFVVSRFIQEYVLSISVDTEVTLIRCPFEISTRKKEKKDKIKVISAGRLVKEKSFDVFLDAISKIYENVKDKAEFYIVGEGECVNELINLQKELKIKVKFVKGISNIESFYDLTHIFVMSTGNPAEGLGLGIIQAALKKNLIISPSFPSIKELLENRTDGFLFAMGNSTELAGILENVINNYDKMKILSDNFYIKVREEFSYDKNGKIFYEVYSSLI